MTEQSPSPQAIKTGEPNKTVWYGAGKALESLGPKAWKERTDRIIESAILPRVNEPMRQWIETHKDTITTVGGWTATGAELALVAGTVVAGARLVKKLRLRNTQGDVLSRAPVMPSAPVESVQVVRPTQQVTSLPEHPIGLDEGFWKQVSTTDDPHALDWLKALADGEDSFVPVMTSLPLVQHEPVVVGPGDVPSWLVELSQNSRAPLSPSVFQEQNAHRFQKAVHMDEWNAKARRKIKKMRLHQKLRSFIPVPKVRAPAPEPSWKNIHRQVANRSRAEQMMHKLRAAAPKWEAEQAQAVDAMRSAARLAQDDKRRRWEAIDQQGVDAYQRAKVDRIHAAPQHDRVQHARGVAEAMGRQIDERRDVYANRMTADNIQRQLDDPAYVVRKKFEQINASVGEQQSSAWYEQVLTSLRDLHNHPKTARRVSELALRLQDQDPKARWEAAEQLLTLGYAHVPAAVQKGFEPRPNIISKARYWIDKLGMAGLQQIIG